MIECCGLNRSISTWTLLASMSCFAIDEIHILRLLGDLSLLGATQTVKTSKENASVMLQLNITNLRTVQDILLFERKRVLPLVLARDSFVHKRMRLDPLWLLLE